MMWNKKQTIIEKKRAVREWLLGATCRGFLLTAIVVLVVLNVTKTSTVSTKGFELGDLQMAIDKLHHETARLDVEIADYRSMKSLEARIATLNMVGATEFTYVAPVGTAVARR